MSYSGDPASRDVDVITPRMVEDYMKQMNQRELISEFKGKFEQNIASRQKIVQFAVDYLMTNYGDEVDMFKRKMIANALVKLFPFMGLHNGQNVGVVCLICLSFTNRIEIVILLLLCVVHL